MTAISFANTPAGSFLFTRRRDSMVRAWDFSRKHGMWHLHIGDDFVVIGLHFDLSTQKLTVFTRSTVDSSSARFYSCAFEL